jgi:uncharacterized protein (TIGR01777 family)
MYKILMTGGSGFIGTHLTSLFKKSGYHVEHIGRSRNSKAGVKTWLYNVKKGFVENGAFNLEGFEGFFIVHLAGEGIMDKPWTEERKKSIVDSRVQTIKILYEECVKRKQFPEAVVSASGIAWYGLQISYYPFTEEEPPSTDFIGQCCVEWEKAARLFEPHCPVSCLRTPLVLDAREGGLPLMVAALNFGIKIIIAPGNQYVAWVHIHDLCHIYLFAFQKKLNGPYNVVASTQPTYRAFMNSFTPIAKNTKFKAWLRMKVPVWAVRFLYGQRNKLVTTGSMYSNAKLIKAGFEFHFQEVRDALEDLYLEQ